MKTSRLPGFGICWCQRLKQDASPISACALETADGVEVMYQNRENTVLRIGTLPLPGNGDGVLRFEQKSDDYDCEGAPEDLPARITQITDDALTFQVVRKNRGTATYVVDRADSCDMPDLDGTEGCK